MHVYYNHSLEPSHRTGPGSKCRDSYMWLINPLLEPLETIELVFCFTLPKWNTNWIITANKWKKSYITTALKGAQGYNATQTLLGQAMLTWKNHVGHVTVGSGIYGLKQ